MSHVDQIDLTGNRDGEAEQMEVGGASSVFFVCFYVRIVYLRKRERAGSVPSYFFQRSKFSSLASRFGYFQTERERKEREKTTEKVRRRGA